MTLASVIVPTRNSATTLDACLRSIRDQTHADIELIVVDNASTDATKEIARRHADHVLDRGPERTAQRNAGGHLAQGDVLLFIDSDMQLEPGVVAQAVAEIARGADQVVIPERSFGQGFWSDVKAFERSLYVGDESIEAARAFSARTWRQVGGYDEMMIAAEDWDLDRRVRALGGSSSRTRAFIDHDEGRLTLGETLRTKYYYGTTAARYFGKHGGAARRNASPLRPAFVRHWRRLAARPITAAAMIVMKIAELAAGAAGLAAASARARIVARRAT